jgi:hypothetical protein
MRPGCRRTASPSKVSILSDSYADGFLAGARDILPLALGVSVYGLAFGRSAARRSRGCAAMDERWALIGALAVGAFMIRFGARGSARPFLVTGAAARALNALVRLPERGAGGGWCRAASRNGPRRRSRLAAAVVTRNMPATMAVGIAAIWMLRHAW